MEYGQRRLQARRVGPGDAAEEEGEEKEEMFCTYEKDHVMYVCEGEGSVMAMRWGYMHMLDIYQAVRMPYDDFGAGGYETHTCISVCSSVYHRMRTCVRASPYQ